MQLSEQAKKYLLEASKWANFIAIVGFIAIGLLIIMSFSIGTILANLPEGSLGGLSPKFFSFFYLIAAGVYFIPVFFLFQFGQKTKQALMQDDHNLLTFGLKKLRSHYKFIGILFIVFISLYIFLILFGAFGALIS
ncbi:DUF5362 family protein [Lutimonas vermicola]|uniref:DUF5362 family protein n=1 Tax=Lutimonas vermicola TaxID=414288 RepID=A0ABU9KZ31_9FLAO